MRSVTWLVLVSTSSLAISCKGNVSQKTTLEPVQVEVAVKKETVTFTLHKNALTEYSARLWVELPDPRPKNVRLTWFKNGKPVTDGTSGAPLATTTAIAKIEGPVASPLLDTVFEKQQWRVDVAAEGVTGVVTQTAELDLTHTCSAIQWGQSGKVECDSKHVFALALTSPVPVNKELRGEHLLTVTAELLANEAIFSRFRRFVNIMYLSEMDADPMTPVLFDPVSYTTSGGYDPIVFFDRTCIDVPLTGTMCLHSHIVDVDLPLDSTIVEFYAESAVFPDGDDGFNVIVVPVDSSMDMLIQPPIDPSLIDVTDGTAPAPEQDLSNYIKAYGKLWIDLPCMLFRVNPKSGTSQLNFRFAGFLCQSQSSYRYQWFKTFTRGPFCHNNLGTHGIMRGTMPFDIAGLPLFPGFVSDVTWDSGFAQPLTTYNALDIAPYPHLESSANGGSGVGRDAFGAGVNPYSFGETVDLASDNPNNCRRPADACTVPGIQDGGPDAGASCQSPNISDDSDDATYRKSQIFSNPVSYLQ